MGKYFILFYLSLILINLSAINTLESPNLLALNQKKNLLIGAISNYNWEKIKIFFTSFKESKFQNCECIIYVSNMSQSTIDKIESSGCLILQMPKKYDGEPIINARFAIYYDYLKENGDKYNLVFTADVRDVVFQRDVFQFYDSSKPFLGIALEDGYLTEQFNTKWLINGFGEDVYEAIKNERIICSGTVWGTPDKFGEYSKAVWENSKIDKSGTMTPEQGVTNYLIYYKKMFNDCLIKSFNNDGYVMTIGLTDNKKIRLDIKLNVLNFKGEVPAIVHQYDRYPVLVKLINEKYFPESNSRLLIYTIFAIIIIILISILIYREYNRHLNKNMESFRNEKKIEMYKMTQNDDSENLNDKEASDNDILINKS